MKKIKIGIYFKINVYLKKVILKILIKLNAKVVNWDAYTVKMK